MPKHEQNLWDNLTDHPKIAGALALIALAVSFSPKLSSVACWLCLFAAYILVMAAVDGSPTLLNSPHRSKLMLVVAIAFAAFVLQFGLWLNRPKLEGSPEETQFRLGKLIYLQPGVGQPERIDVYFQNIGPSNITLKTAYNVAIVDSDRNIHFGPDNGEDYQVQANSIVDVEEQVWTAFEAKISRDPKGMSGAIITTPFQSHWTSLLGPPISKEEILALYERNDKVLIFVTARFTWQVEGSDRVYAYDLCNFITESNETQFACVKHNGPTMLP
jgi:hypothetical protein